MANHTTASQRYNKRLDKIFENAKVLNAKHDAIRAREAIESMSESDFQLFFQSLPARVQLLVRGGMCDWREVLPQYLKQS